MDWDGSCQNQLLYRLKFGDIFAQYLGANWQYSVTKSIQRKSVLFLNYFPENKTDTNILMKYTHSKKQNKKTLLQDPGSVVGEAEDCRIVQMMFTYFGQKVCATLNPVAPAKGHPITPSLAARMCTKAVCWVGLMLQASCSFRSLGFWWEKTPDHFCGFQQSLFKSWEKILKKKKKVYVSAEEEELVCKQAEKNIWTRFWFYASWSLVLAGSFQCWVAFFRDVQLVLP